MSSKHFKPEEIIGYMEIDGKRVVYLKEGVKRLRRYQDHLSSDHVYHLNYYLINKKRYERFLKEVVGLDDHENNEN